MTSMTTDSPARSRLSTANKVGLALAGLLGAGDLTSLVSTPTPAPGEAGPPMVVLVAATILGVITLIGVVYTWRTSSRVGARVVAGSRILSALTAVPAFLVEGVPPALIAVAAFGIIATAVAVFLVLKRPSTTQG